MMHPQQEPDHQPQAVPPMPMNPTPDIPPESLPGRGDAPTEHAGEFF